MHVVLSKDVRTDDHQFTSYNTQDMQPVVRCSNLRYFVPSCDADSNRIQTAKLVVSRLRRLFISTGSEKYLHVLTVRSIQRVMLEYLECLCYESYELHDCTICLIS